ncbi:MAG TPA: glycosyltransferase [Candidatus Sulfotelmatobacter sp.]|nr:glycosyltransferase [Candidatus Sulfotelmatobacter sp.]
MKILFATARNPHFLTITEYIERAVRGLGHDLVSFDDRGFLLPGRLREAFLPLGRLDLSRLNRRLAEAVQRERPDILLCAGGERIQAATVEGARRAGSVTVLWTIDPPRQGDPRFAVAPAFDFVFCGGTEMIEALKICKLPQAPHWLPFACDPDLHHPLELSPDDRDRYGCDIAFVGSLHRQLYPNRITMLEALAGFDLAVWGPGATAIPAESPLLGRIRGDQTPYEVWTRIYSAARIVLCAHYDRPGLAGCLQASPRVYEALACGAFLLCDDQPDVRALFEDGRHLVTYRSLDHLREQARYYLHHERERRQIAECGRAEVLARHTYRHRVAALLATVMGAR